jgi:MGT family glycosyltransferase
MTRFLLVTWDGAGNLVPTLGLARRLSARGHEVRVLGHRSIERRCGSGGWRFHPLRHAPEFDSAAGQDGAGDMSAIARQLWFSGAVARDVGDELARDGADVIVADCLLFGALSAAQAADVPAVALFHGALAPFRHGPFFDMLTAMLPELNAIRADLGLTAAARISDVYDACALSLVANPRELEPDMPVPANVRFAGPFLDAPPLLAHADNPEIEADGRPLIVVSFSTSQQGHAAVLQRVVDGLASIDAQVVVTTGPALEPASLRAAGGVRIVRFVPHDRLFARTSLVVTHAGMGTVMSALAYGVPLLCLPVGRDQFFNAARVAAIGAGTVLNAGSDPAAIASAALAVLGNPDAAIAARRMADVIAGYRNGAAAMADLEALAARTSRQNRAMKEG